MQKLISIVIVVLAVGCVVVLTATAVKQCGWVAPVPVEPEVCTCDGLNNCKCFPVPTMAPGEDIPYMTPAPCDCENEDCPPCACSDTVVCTGETK